jgi:FixJ family two-component response regulator
MSTQDMPTVFIVDDDTSVREAIRDLLQSVGLHCQPVAAAQEFLSSKRGEAPSCLILDVRLPGIIGLDLQHELKRAGIRIAINFTTAHADIPMTVKAMKSGAAESLKPVQGARPARCRAVIAQSRKTATVSDLPTRRAHGSTLRVR